MKFRRAFLMFLSVVVSVTPCYSNAMKESDNYDSLPVNQSKEIEKCAICLQPMEKEKNISQFAGCSHYFHTKCLDDWVSLVNRDNYLNNKVTCPLCRASACIPRICHLCGKPVTRNDLIFRPSVSFRCGHCFHGACCVQLKNYMTKHNLATNKFLRFCYACSEPGLVQFIPWDEKKIQEDIQRLSPIDEEKLKMIANKLQPELSDDRPSNRQTLKKIALLAILTFLATV